MSASAAQNLELAKNYSARCEFQLAIPLLHQASESFYKAQDLSKFLECQNFLLRAYAERDDSKSINDTKERLQDLVLKAGLELSSKTYYVLGICTFYKGQIATALEYFQKSLSIALTSGSKEDLCYSIAGLSIAYTRQNRFADALKEIEHLQVFFEVLDLADVRMSTQILNGVILRKLERYDEALEVLWKCFDLFRSHKNLFMYIQLLYVLGVTYQEMGDMAQAKIYLELAQRSCDPENLKVLSRKIADRLDELGSTPTSTYDLVYNFQKKSVTEKKHGTIDFRNQFILLELLHLFMKAPGQIFSKELLTQRIWGENYNPHVHDNKIYVTIKRLRRMIESNYEKPKYIFRAKNGYFFNKGARILIESEKSL